MIVNVPSDYVHALRGRLRVKLRAVKRSDATAAHVEERLTELDGVERVRANPLTGNVLVIYDPDSVGELEILKHLQDLGYLRPKGSRTERREPALSGRGATARRVIETAAVCLIEAGLKRLVGTLL